MADSKKNSTTKAKAPVKSKRSHRQSVRNFLSKEESILPDLNAGTGYPAHPNRIWPD